MVVAVFVVVIVVVAAAASSSSSSSSSSLSLSRAAVQHGMDACTMSVPAWMLAPCGWIMAQGIKLAQISSHGMDARTISMPAWILAPCGWAMAQGSSWLKDQAGSRQAFRSFAIFFSSTVFLLRLGCRSGGPEQNKNIHQVASL